MQPGRIPVTSGLPARLLGLHIPDGVALFGENDFTQAVRSPIEYTSRTRIPAIPILGMFGYLLLVFQFVLSNQFVSITFLIVLSY
jgi:hypothetical protein